MPLLEAIEEALNGPFFVPIASSGAASGETCVS